MGSKGFRVSAAVATAGLIAVGADGIATPFTTQAMPRAWRIGDGPTGVAIDA
jgi:beta-aspartyl-peptidase (threonine type)